MEIATYTYLRKEGAYPFAQMVAYSMKVEILDDSKNYIKIRFLGHHADGRPPGHETTVKPKSLKRVKIEESASRSGKTAQLNKYLENLDPELIRKPYKDD